MKLLTIIFLFIVQATFSQTYEWNNKNGGSWNNPLNWTPNRTNPTPTDILIIELQQGNALDIINIPTQTIGKLYLTAKNNGNNKTITLTPINTTAILTINGAIDQTIPYDLYLDKPNLNVIGDNIDIILGASTASLINGVLQINNLTLLQ